MQTNSSTNGELRIELKPERAGECGIFQEMGERITKGETPKVVYNPETGHSITITMPGN
jgi:hypothetical protein